MACKGAGKSYDKTYCPHSADPLDDAIHVCTCRLLFCMEMLCGWDNEWAKHVDMATIQG
jgi:hypothetical protein